MYWGFIGSMEKNMESITQGVGHDDVCICIY